MAPQTDADAVAQLNAAGIPASVVVLGAEIGNHAQLRTRSFIEPIDHPVCGEVPCASLPFRFESSPGPWTKTPAPLLGQHNREVLGGELGLTDEELAELESKGVIGTRPAGL